MKLKLTFVLLTLAIFQTLPAQADGFQEKVFEKELSRQAKEKIKLFAKDLKKTLKQGLKAQGPVAAIELCHSQAPDISKEHSFEGWSLSRASLKARNASNMASEWQVGILQEFEDKKLAGIPVKALETSLVRDDRFYFIKAIPTAPLCTTCHGAELSVEVKTRLADLYPNDQAVGFRAGDIRGAFIVSKRLNELE